MSFHRDLRTGLDAPGLFLVAAPTGQGKTTAIENVLANPACPPNVVFMGDLHGDCDAARRAVSLARSQVVIAVLRIGRAASAFARLLDMGVLATEVADVSRLAFSTRLFRLPNSEFELLHEQLVVTDAIRALIVEGGDPDAIHRRAIAEGMHSLRQKALEQARAGRFTPELAAAFTSED